MKHFLPISLAFLLAACVTTPQDKQADHQRELWKEAQANFIALKASEHPNRPPAPTPTPQQLAVLRPQATPNRVKPSPTPGQRLSAFASPEQRAQKPQKPQRIAQATPKPQPKIAAKSKPTPKPSQRIARNQDDTVYYWQVPAPPRGTPARFQIAEVKYARTLAKRPEDLTPEERNWAHEHY